MSRLLILDIDGLRQDVFHRALAEGMIPHLSALLGNRPLHLDPLSTAPSITFCAQTTIFTGEHPDRHGVPGNQFFDRFLPRFYAFDIGDQLAVDDAVAVFSPPPGLLDRVIAAGVPTLYELAAARGVQSLVANHMIARGASRILRPGLVELARFVKGGSLAGISAGDFDDRMVSALSAALRQGASPGVITAYFMGLDHQSHSHGPAVQMAYLSGVVEGQVGRLRQTLADLGWLNDLLVVVVSDHGSVAVLADDAHSLRLGFPFDREMGYLFDALGLDVHDYPGEGPDCSAVVACNGGLAQVFLRREQAPWASPADFSKVCRVAQAFWQANLDGSHAPDLKGALSGVLVRDVESQGWQANYLAFTPQGLQPLAEYFSNHPEIAALDGVERLEHLAGPHSGDVLLLANIPQGYYFGLPMPGVHGGLHPDESLAVLSFGFPTSQPIARKKLQRLVRAQVAGRRATLADMLPILRRFKGW